MTIKELIERLQRLGEEFGEDKKVYFEEIGTPVVELIVQKGQDDETEEATISIRQKEKKHFM